MAKAQMKIKRNRRVMKERKQIKPVDRCSSSFFSPSCFSLLFPFLNLEFCLKTCMQYVLKVSIYNPFSNPKITNSNCLKQALDRLGCGPEQVCCGPKQVGRLTSLHRISEMPCCWPEQVCCGPEQVRRKWYCPVAGRNKSVVGRNSLLWFISSS